MDDRVIKKLRDLNELFANSGLPPLSRRGFLKALTMASLSLQLTSCGGDDSDADTDADTDSDTDGKSIVYIVSATDRIDGLAQLLAMTDLSFASGRRVVLKPNFNSANDFPASTHDDTIRSIVSHLNVAGSSGIVLAESSGPSGTQSVIEAKGTLALCNELGIDFVNFDEMADSEWETFDFNGNGWAGGLAIPRMMRSDDAIVLLPCCKTHEYGGHFTMSLKLAVGLVPKSRRYELHEGYIRSLIADINMGFTPDLVVMDALSCFITGGPDSGTVMEPGLLLASKDRVALDAVGVAVLLRAGCETLSGGIFGQDQIVRAVELELGAALPDDIELVGEDQAVKSELRAILDEG